MSQYVEARYALLTLQRAREASQQRATKLLTDLLEDLGAPQDNITHRADLLTAVQHLTLVLQSHRMPPPCYWEAACQAAHAWCSASE
jgi:hypothetical protein